MEERQKSVTEITCHAQGIKELCNHTRVLIDIGGQDSKVIMQDKEGKVVDFVMNDKSAAGTGRFMETMARALQVDIQELGEMDHGATGEVALSNMCTVFAESEVVSLIANDTEINEIVNGLNRSIASRINSMVKRIVKDFNGLSFSMSGGVAHNKGVVRALSEVLGDELTIPDNPDNVGAYGAALIAGNKGQ